MNTPTTTKAEETTKSPKAETKAPPATPPSTELATTGKTPTGLAPLPADFSLALEPRDMTEAFKLAINVAASGMYGVRNPEDALMRIMTGRSLGFGAMTSLRVVYCIPDKEGRAKPALYSDAIVALTRQHPAVEYIRLVETNSKKCVYVGKRKGDPQETKIEWTIEMAEAANLLDRGPSPESKKMNNWNRYPDAMLRARAGAAICKIVEPGAAIGMRSVEELVDEKAITVHPETGEVTDIPTTVAAKPARDYEKDVTEIKLAISVMTTQDQRKAVREQIKAAELPTHYAKELTDLYNARMSTLKEQAAAAPPAKREREPGEEG